MKTNIPTSVCKKLLAETGCRVSSPAVVKFKEQIIEWSKEAAKKAAENAASNKRKTIFPEDL